MALGLHPECISRLNKVVAEQLQKVLVNHGMFLDYPSTIGFRLTDPILPNTGKVRDSLRDYIGEFPLATFLKESISRELLEGGEYQKDTKASPLSSVPSHSDLDEVANRLIQDFEGLPWTFMISLKIPGGLGRELRALIGRVDLGESLRLVSPDPTYDTVFPLQSGIEERDTNLFGGFSKLASVFVDDKEKQWNQESVYLQADVQGFIGRFGKTSPFEDAIADFKSFFGLSMAVRLLTVKTEDLLTLFGLPLKNWLSVHRRLDDQWQIWLTDEVSPDFSKLLNRLEIDDLDGKVREDQIAGWVKGQLAEVSTAFERREQARRILQAGQWLLDSYLGSNDLLSFVQAAVAMEILLGEETKSDIIGISELLRNRCAYLIGKSQSQREAILSEFVRIYEVRSKIVHQGKNRLNYEERVLFQKLRWMCGRVIQEELELLSADKLGG